MTTDAIELSTFFDEPEITPATYARYADAAHESFAARERFESLLSDYRERLQQKEGEPLKLAVGLFMLGSFTAALEAFAACPEGRVRRYYAAQAALALNRFDEALADLKKAAQQGWEAVEIDLLTAAVQVRAGDHSAAEAILRKREAEGHTRADWHYVRGLLAEATGDRVGAGAAFEQALSIDPNHTQALFRSARLYDLCGDDEQALEFNYRLTGQSRAYVNALLNAAVVYEDRGDYDEAMTCLRRVLKAYPNHRRARLFMKSVESCRQQVIEEGGEERIDARARLLATPISEFELSVRARNCLKKMNIRTIGELMRLSEPELLAYKNFGETSLNEIKALLSKKGLRLGQAPEEISLEVAEQVAATPKVPVPPGQEALLSKPVSELELSVRSRRCLQRLNVQSLAELVLLSEADLLATRNFGVTSLNEIKARLAEHGLQLANKPAH